MIKMEMSTHAAGYRARQQEMHGTQDCRVERDNGPEVAAAGGMIRRYARSYETMNAKKYDERKTRATSSAVRGTY